MKLWHVFSILFLAFGFRTEAQTYTAKPKALPVNSTFTLPQNAFLAPVDLANSRGIQVPAGTQVKVNSSDPSGQGHEVTLPSGKKGILSNSQMSKSTSLGPYSANSIGKCIHTPVSPKTIQNLKTSDLIPIPEDGKNSSTKEPLIEEQANQGQPISPSSQQGEVSNRTIGSTNIGQISNSLVLADRARALELIDSAIGEKNKIRRSAGQDQRLLSRPYFDLPLEKLGKALGQASDILRDSASVLETAESGLPQGEIARFRNFFMNADQLAEAGEGVIGQQLQEKARESILPFQGFSGPKDLNPLARNDELSQIFGSDSLLKSANTQEGLLNRLVMLNGLPEAERKKALKQLRLADFPRLKLKDGRELEIPILHNGYLLGKGPDCSSFVSSVLPTDVRKGRFTTLDFRSMWLYLKSGKIPRPPKWKDNREKLIKSTAKAFFPVDVYSGQRPIPGDILVYRLDFQTVGHVFIIRDYNPNTMVARVIDSSQSTGTIAEREFSLTVYPSNAPVRHLRPGLFALRLKGSSNNACKYKKDQNKNIPTAGFSVEEFLSLAYLLQFGEELGGRHD